MRTEPGRSRRDLVGIVVLFLLFCWFCFNWFSTVAHVLRYYNPLPVSDYWRVIEDLPAMEAGDSHWLWRQHNEHRIIFPEIFFALDELMLAGRQVLPLVLNFFCYVGTVVLLGWTFWHSTDAPRRTRAQALLLGGIIAGWPLSTLVLGTPFLLQWTLLQFAVVLALTCLPTIRGKFGVLGLLAVIVCGIAATFSSANGLVLWPILLVIAGLLRAGGRHLIALAGSACICTGLFFVGYHRPNASVLTSLGHPIYWLCFVVSYLSMPFGVLRNPAFGIAFGLSSLAGWLACFARSIQSRTLLTSTFKVVAFGYFGFLLLTASLTSTARLDLTDTGFSNAKAARYVTLSLLGWTVLVLLALTLSLREKWKLFTPTVILALVVVIVGFMQIRLDRWLRTNDDYVSHQQWAALSLQNELFDPAVLGSVFPKKAFIERYLPVLRATHKSIFAERAVGFPGQRFRSVFSKVRSKVEPGGVVRLTPMQGGLSVIGWAADLDRQGKNTVVFVDQSGTIVGFGRHLASGLPRELMPFPAAKNQFWVGYINGRYRSSSFVAYLSQPEVGSASPISHEVSLAATLGAVSTVGHN